MNRIDRIKETIKLLYDLFELNSEPFYYDLLRLDFAIWVFLMTSFISLLVAIIYYYIIDRPKTSKLGVWLVFLVLSSGLLSVFAYISANNAIIEDYTPDVPDYSEDLIYFSGINFIIGGLLFLIFSIAIKWWSRNSSHVPF